MSPEVAKIILQFLARVQLQGAEVPAFNRAIAELQPLVEPKPRDEQPTPPDA